MVFTIARLKPDTRARLTVVSMGSPNVGDTPFVGV